MTHYTNTRDTRNRAVASYAFDKHFGRIAHKRPDNSTGLRLPERCTVLHPVFLAQAWKLLPSWAPGPGVLGRCPNKYCGIRSPRVLSSKFFVIDAVIKTPVHVRYRRQICNEPLIECHRSTFSRPGIRA